MWVGRGRERQDFNLMSQSQQHVAVHMMLMMMCELVRKKGFGIKKVGN